LKIFKNKVFSNLFWNISSKVLLVIIKFFTIPILITEYTDSGYGLIILATSIFLYLRIIEMGAPMGIVKYTAEWLANKDYDTINKVSSSYFIIYIAIGLLNFTILYLLAEYGQLYFFSNLSQDEWITFKVLLLIAAFSSIFSYVSSLFNQLLTGAEDIAWLSRIDVAKKILEVILILAIVLFPGKIQLVNYYLIIQIINYLFLPIIIFRWNKYNSIINSLFDGWHFKSFLPVFKYGVGVFLIEIFRVSFLQLRPFVFQFRSLNENVTQMIGYYGVILSISMIINLIAGSLMTVLVPALSRYAVKENDIKLRNHKINQYTKQLNFIFLLPLTLLIIISPYLLKLYLGDNYVFLTSYLKVWLIFSALALVTTVYTSSVFSIGKIRSFFWITCCSSIISLAFIWFTTPLLSLWAIVLGTVLYRIIRFFSFAFYISPYVIKIKTSSLFKTIYPSLVTSAFVIIINYLFLINCCKFLNTFEVLTIGLITGTLSYISFYIIVFRNSTEVKKIKQMVKTNFKF